MINRDKFRKIINGEVIGDYSFDPKSRVWTIVLDKGDFFDTKSQDVAEVLSQLIEIKQLLKRKK